jgi:hypothetical protein
MPAAGELRRTIMPDEERALPSGRALSSWVAGARGEPGALVASEVLVLEQVLLDHIVLDRFVGTGVLYVAGRGTECERGRA